MQVSVLIPTFKRPAKLAACVEALSRQTLDSGDAYEVLVGIDGADAESESAARRAWDSDRLRIFPLAKQGQAAIRNRLLKEARGRTLVFLNDDMVPEHGFLGAHLRCQREEEAAGRAALIVGDSPWKVHEGDSLFDRLVRETSMVFFYNVMKERPDPGHDWGFRHAWLLNLSAPAALVREVGGFTVFPSTYGYEDDELAFRLAKRFGTRVLFRPEARAVHDHRLTPEAYLKREHTLGFSAWGFARTAPECARAMFHRDITGEDELRYCRDVLEREAGLAQRLERSFGGLAGLPAEIAGGEDGRALIDLAYEHHLPLKRFCWRRGLVEAAGR